MGIKIAVAGRIRSGKDEFSKLFIKDGYHEFKFGTGIAEIIMTYFPEDWMKGKPRTHYQHIGQQLRQLDPDVWINYVFRDIEDYLYDNPYGDIIITDLRQVNEAERLRDEGFLIVKVVSRDDIRIQRMKQLGDQFNQEDLNHETEKQVDKILADIVVENNGSLKHLQSKAREVKKAIERGA